jgi:hypothetical protein
VPCSTIPEVLRSELVSAVEIGGENALTDDRVPSAIMEVSKMAIDLMV